MITTNVQYLHLSNVHLLQMYHNSKVYQNIANVHYYNYYNIQFF